MLDVDRYINHRRNIYDNNWNYLNIETDCEKLGNKINKPFNLDEMKEIAEILSKDFPFVRVDLYSINGKINFGELTFYPWSGYVQFTPEKFDFEIGKKIILSKFE